MRKKKSSHVSKSLGRGIQWQHSTSVPFTPVLLLWWKHKPAARCPHWFSSREQFRSIACSAALLNTGAPCHTCHSFFLDNQATFLPQLAHSSVLKHPELAYMHLHSHRETKRSVVLPRIPLIPHPGPCQHRLPSPACTTAIIFPTEVPW